MCSDPLDPCGEVPGCSGLNNRHVGHIAFRVHSSSQVHREFSEPKSCIFMWVRFGCGEISFFFVFLFFILRTNTACCKYEAALPNLPLY